MEIGRPAANRYDDVRERERLLSLRTQTPSRLSHQSQRVFRSIPERERGGGNDCRESIRCASAGWEGRKERVASTLLLAKVDKIVFPSTRRTLLWNDTVQTRKLPTKQMIARYHGDFQEEKEEEKKTSKDKRRRRKRKPTSAMISFHKRGGRNLMEISSRQRVDRNKRHPTTLLFSFFFFCSPLALSFYWLRWWWRKKFV